MFQTTRENTLIQNHTKKKNKKHEEKGYEKLDNKKIIGAVDFWSPEYQVPFHYGNVGHRWDLPVLRYLKIMVIYPYPFLVVINQLFSCIIFIDDCICILTGSPG